MAKKRTGKMPVLRVNTDFFPQKHFHNFHDFHDFHDSAGSGCKPVIPAFQLLLPLEVSPIRTLSGTKPVFTNFDASSSSCSDGLTIVERM